MKILPGAAIALMAWGAACADVRYSVYAVPLPAGTQHSTDLAISDSGVVVGQAYSDDFLYRTGYVASGAEATALSFTPRAINGAGDIVGFGQIWSGGVTSSLPALPGDLPMHVFTLGINDGGQAVGQSSSLDGDFYMSHAVSWVNGTPSAVAIPDGYVQSSAVGINNHGVVAGNVVPFNGVTPPARAFVEDHGAVTVLPAPDGAITVAMGINDDRTVIGTYTLFGSADTFPIRWDDGAMTLLPTHADADITPWAINRQGLIVGYGNVRGGSESFPVLWDENLNLIDLQTMIPADSGWELWTAMGINSSGQIVGEGSYQGVERAYVLTPVGVLTVPEPSVIGVTFFAALGVGRRRRW